MVLLRGIAGCQVYAGQSEIVVLLAGYLALCGRADGRDVVVDGMLRRTVRKYVHYADELVVNNNNNNIVDLYVLFLRRAHSPDRPPLDSNPLPTDYETRALTNAPPGTVPNPLDAVRRHLLF